MCAPTFVSAFKVISDARRGLTWLPLFRQLVTSAGCPESNQWVFNSEKRGNPRDLRKTDLIIPSHQGSGSPVTLPRWIKPPWTAPRKLIPEYLRKYNEVRLVSSVNYTSSSGTSVWISNSGNGSSSTVAGDYAQVHVLRLRYHSSNHCKMGPLDSSKPFLSDTIRGLNVQEAGLSVVFVALQEFNQAATTKAVKEHQDVFTWKC